MFQELQNYPHFTDPVSGLVIPEQPEDGGELKIHRKNVRKLVDKMAQIGQKIALLRNEKADLNREGLIDDKNIESMTDYFRKKIVDVSKEKQKAIDEVKRKDEEIKK